VKQFLSVPFAAEDCGRWSARTTRPRTSPSSTRGETDDATFEKPTSTRPHTHKFPRPAISCVWRKDGGRVGS
jgi:hypothetical protein